MPIPVAPRATIAPTCPSPTRPSVFSETSTPLKALRFHSPSRRELSAAGMRRAAASMRPRVCSAAATVLLSGALATRMPRLVAASMSMLSTPMPARPMALRFSARSTTSSVTLVALRIDEAVVVADALAGAPRAMRPEDNVDVELLLQELNAGVGELLGYEDLQAATPLFEKTRWAAPTPLPSSTGWSSVSSASSAAAIVAIMS